MRRLLSVCLIAVFAGAVVVSAGQAQPTAKPAFTPETRKQLIESLNRGADFVRKAQKPDGTWENHPGVTAMVAAALLRQTGVPREKTLQTTGKTLDYLKSLAKPDGGIYEKMIPHYITAVSVQALAAGGRASDKATLEKARVYLAEHLLDEGEGIAKSDKFYGGMGYGGTSDGGIADGGMGYGGTSDGGIADIISLEYGLRAMKEAELPANDPAWQKAITFLQRTQNHKETNDQAWSTNDGGFVYYPGYSQVDATTQSYGSGTYAGLMSYAWANLQKNDRRVQNALKWIAANYTVEENPGIGTKALYYYYMVFAKALQAMGDPIVVDAKGVAHNWREDLGKKLIA
ncbi:MAG: squalene-hopene cyclase, partial [Acidimicrobiaceae bacterium]